MLFVEPTVEEYRFECLARLYSVGGSMGIDFASEDLFYRRLKLKIDFRDEWPSGTYLDIAVRRGIKLYASPTHIYAALRRIYATLNGCKDREFAMPGTTLVPDTFSEFFANERALLQYQPDPEIPWRYTEECGCTIPLNIEHFYPPPGLIYQDCHPYDDEIPVSAPDIAWCLRSVDFTYQSPEWDPVINSHLSQI